MGKADHITQGAKMATKEQSELEAAEASLTAAANELGEELAVVVKEPRAEVPETAIATNPENFIAMAMELKYPPEIIKQFLDMRKELKAEWAKEQYFNALSRFQGMCPDILKTIAVLNKEKAGEARTVRYKYAPLGQIVKTVREALQECGFSYTIHPVQQDENEVTAKVVAHHKDGHFEESSFSAPIDKEAYMNAPQKVAGARSYAKRQAFCDVFGIVTADEDDDAQSLTFDSGVRYADYINGIEAQTDLASLFDTVKAYRNQLREQGDQKGVDLITKVYEKRKKALS
jgi:hypothetical protein